MTDSRVQALIESLKEEAHLRAREKLEPTGRMHLLHERIENDLCMRAAREIERLIEKGDS
jgi:hypothetical protein